MGFDVTTLDLLPAQAESALAESALTESALAGETTCLATRRGVTSAHSIIS
ncbi:hypothetical protein ACSDR0_12910 [Streptosporangium sp. G11]|uniref:hypothetical protein n=1 Tax=Streptosporangium sp. G11 TaxID=3436926 RepID=UPI003EC05E79